MSWESQIPRIATQASLRTQAAVEKAGQEVEYHALEIASRRRRTGQEMGQIKWRPAPKGRHYGRVVSNFITRFHEYGTVFMSATPTLGPAADMTEENFLHDMSKVYDVG